MAASSSSNGYRSGDPLAVDRQVQAIWSAIEATGITRRVSFSQAVEEGSKKLRRRLEFDCLIDVYHARHLGVTPLPVIFEGAS